MIPKPFFDWVRRNKLIALAIPIFFILLVSGVFVYWRFWGQPQSSGQFSINPSKHPWSQFHGNYFHTGYADVTGPDKAALKWKFQLGKVAGGDPNSVAISSDGTVYVAGAGKIFALGKNGNEIWSKSYQSTKGPALSEDGTIHFLSMGTVIALDQDGKEKWKFKTNGDTYFGPTIGPDGTIYQGSWDGYFYAINTDGTLKWKYKTEGSVSYPASIDQNGVIYLGGGDAHSGPDSNLYAFNPDGTLRWKYDTKALRVGSPAIGSDGLIYVPAAPDLIVLDSSGNLKWKKGSEVGFQNIIKVAYAEECGPPPLPACSGGAQPPTGDMPQPGNGDTPQPLPVESGVAGIITPAISSDGTIYIGNSQGILSAVDSKTQEVKWTYQTGADPKQPGFRGLPSFPLVDKEGTVYIGSVDGKMYAVSRDGKLLWDYQTGGKITEAAPALDSGGVLYFTSEDGYLYAIGN